MKKVLTLITFLSMACTVIAQCPGSKAEEYERKQQELKSKSAREKAELPGMLGQAYSQASTYYMYKCMCENGFAKNDEGKKEIAAAANTSAEYFNSAKISGEPKLPKIDPNSCTLAKKGSGSEDNETTNYIIPEKGLFFNNKMMSNLNAIAAESDSEELKTIVADMNEVHRNTNYIRENYNLDQGQTEMLNTWENIGQVATILVANSIKKDEEYDQQLRARNELVKRQANNMEYSKIEFIREQIGNTVDSLRVEYLFPAYISDNLDFKSYLVREFNNEISTYYPILDLNKEMLQDYYVWKDINKNYKDNMTRYPFDTQKEDFLNKWNKSCKELWFNNSTSPVSSEERTLLKFTLVENKLVSEEELVEYFGMNYQEDTVQTLLKFSVSFIPSGYGYMLPIYLNSKYQKTNEIDTLLKIQENAMIARLKNYYITFSSFDIHSFADIGQLDKKEIKKLKKAKVDYNKYFSDSKRLSPVTSENDLAFSNIRAHNYLIKKEYKKTLAEIEQTEAGLINLYEVASISEINEAFLKPYRDCNGRKELCFTYKFFHKFLQMQFFKFDAQLNLKLFTEAKNTFATINKLNSVEYSALSSSLIYYPFPKPFSFEKKIKFYPLYMNYLQTGKLDKALFFDTFDSRLDILNLIEEWKATHIDVEPILLYLN